MKSHYFLVAKELQINSDSCKIMINTIGDATLSDI